MNAKKRGRAQPGSAKASGVVPGRAGWILGARYTCFTESGWGSAEDPFPPWARAKASVCDSVSSSKSPERGGGGAFLSTAPNSGNPPAAGRREGSGVQASRSRWGLEGSSLRGVGGLREANPSLARPVWQLCWAWSAHPTPPHDFPQVHGVGARELLVHHEFGEVGAGLGSPPRPR